MSDVILDLPLESYSNFKGSGANPALVKSFISISTSSPESLSSRSLTPNTNVVLFASQLFNLDIVSVVTTPSLKRSVCC